MATILTKKKDTSGAPSAGDLTNDTGGAELAVNTADKRLYTKDSGGNVVEVGINPTSITTGTLNTSGAVVFNDAGADVDFRVEGDTEPNLLFVDASADAVGMGTGSPSKSVVTGRVLDIVSASGTAGIRAYSGGTGVAFFYNNNTETIISSRGDTASYLAFGTGGSGTERMRITSDGYLRMASGTGGIQFNGDTAAANALDDYEEGTWTPTLTGQTTAGTTTYSSQNGIYTKIGRKVTVSVSIVVTAATGTGSIRIGDLPFTSGGGIACVAPAMVQSYNWSGGSYLVGYVPNNTTFINVYSCSDDASWVAQQMVNESQYWIITATYFTT